MRRSALPRYTRRARCRRRGADAGRLGRNREASWPDRCSCTNNAAILIDEPGGFSASLFEMTGRRFQAHVGNECLRPRGSRCADLIPGMMARGYGRVVNMSSAAGQLSDMGSGFPAYRVSKTALNALTRIAAAETARSDVKVNACSPGWVRTDMGGADAPRTPEKGAETAVWLAKLPADGPTGGFFQDKTPIPW